MAWLENWEWKVVWCNKVEEIDSWEYEKDNFEEALARFDSIELEEGETAYIESYTLESIILEKKLTTKYEVEEEVVYSETKFGPRWTSIYESQQTAQDVFNALSSTKSDNKCLTLWEVEYLNGIETGRTLLAQSDAEL